MVEFQQSFYCKFPVKCAVVEMW